jgi:hypothetical protein
VCVVGDVLERLSSGDGAGGCGGDCRGGSRWFLWKNDEKGHVVFAVVVEKWGRRQWAEIVARGVF